MLIRSDSAPGIEASIPDDDSTRVGAHYRLLRAVAMERDVLRARVAELEAAIRSYRSEMDNPVHDSVMTTTTRRKLFSLIPE